MPVTLGKIFQFLADSESPRTSVAGESPAIIRTMSNSVARTSLGVSDPVVPLVSKRLAGFTGLQVLGVVVVTMLLTVGITYWVVRTYVFPADFEPVALSEREQTQLDGKLRALGIDPPTRPVSAGLKSKPGLVESAQEWLRPEPYAEDPSQREIGLSERELNALLAHNTDLARKLAIDLSDDLASARLLVPIDPDFPFFGGRTLRVGAGLELSYGDGRPVLIVRGVSLMGVPIPNAWLGNLKNVDLVREFGAGAGFWKAFADGVEFVKVGDGQLNIRLRE